MEALSPVPKAHNSSIVGFGLQDTASIPGQQDNAHRLLKASQNHIGIEVQCHKAVVNRNVWEIIVKLIQLKVYSLLWYMVIEPNHTKRPLL
jgi:hypothetical protein